MVCKHDARKKSTTSERAQHRIKIVQGHIKKIEEMLKNGEYCIDIVHQSRAVQSALKNIDLMLIENHLQTCVVSQIQNGKKERATAELLRLFEYK